jgi:hypothetical protein
VGACYSVSVLSDTGTGDNCFIELIAASGVELSVYKITVSLAAAPADTASSRIRVFRTNTASSGMTAGSVVKMDPTSAAAVTTCNVKQAGIFGQSGNEVDTVLDIAFWERQSLEWIARERKEYIRINAGDRMCFRLVCLNSTGNHCYTVYFKE